MLSIQSLTTEYQNHPLGMDEKMPRFSWVMISDCPNTRQKSRRLIVKQLDETVWDSGLVEEENSHLVQYEGIGLEPCTEYQVFLEITDNHGNVAAASAKFETGLMEPARIKLDYPWIPR